MAALTQKWPSGREVRHASFDDVGLVSLHGASERTETGGSTQMAKLVDVSTFDWDKYGPDDIVQKRRRFSVGAGTPSGSLEKRPRYHLLNPRSVASAAIMIKPSRPSVIVASARRNRHGP